MNIYAIIYVGVMLLVAVLTGIGLAAARASGWVVLSVIVLCLMHYWFGKLGKK